MDAGLMKKYCWNRSGIDEENLAEIEAGLIIRILLNESGIFYKINIIFCAEFSETNCRAELSAPNCPTPICPRRIVREPLPDHTLSASGQNMPHLFVKLILRPRLGYLSIFNYGRRTVCAALEFYDFS